MTAMLRAVLGSDSVHPRADQDPAIERINGRTLIDE
jgi:hypothetical protein